MDKVELYRQVFTSFRRLCAEGRQPSSFNAYCKAHGVMQCQMAQVLKGEYQRIKSLPGYTSTGSVCREIYEDFKSLCAEGRQPSTFRAYYKSRGVTRRQMEGFQSRNKLKVVGLPGFTGPDGTGNGRCQEVPFEEVIFEEAGFLPADSGNVITVKVDGHVAVSFPADTDVAVIAKFVRKMGKGVDDVGA